MYGNSNIMLKKHQNNNKNSRKIALVIFIMGLFLLLFNICSQKNDFYLKKQKKENTLSQKSEKNLKKLKRNNDRINIHLHTLERKMQLQKEKTNLENSLNSNKPHMQPEGVTNEDYGVDLYQENNALNSGYDNKRNVYLYDHQDNNREDNYFEDGRNNYFKDNPHYKVQSDLNDIYKQEQYNQMYKEEFVKAFIENARIKGYKVKIDENLIVTEIIPIKKRSASSSYDNSYDNNTNNSNKSFISR